MNDRVRDARRALETRFGSASDASVAGPAPEASVASAPGRVNLIGGHTDYNDGFVLPVAIDRRTVVASRPRTDDRLNAYSIDFGESHTVQIDDLAPREEWGWFNYVAGVFAQLQSRGYEVGGADVVVTGDVPIGAGVGSSAALEVATAASVAASHGIEVRPEQIVRIAWATENEFVGVSCGIMDQFASTFCEAGSALFLDCRSTDFELVPVDTDRVRVLVFDTTVQHELVHSAYNDRVEQCQAAVETFDGLLETPVDSLRDVSRSAFEAHADELPETVRKRCRHVISENQRVQDAAAALQGGDLDEVGDLMHEAHRSLCDDYETSCEELDLVVDLASETDGVLGSRMTGAGFGGSVVSLVERDAVEDAASRLRSGFSAETGIDPNVFVCEPADGLARIPTATE